LKKAAIHRQMLDHLMIQKGTLERRFAQIWRNLIDSNLAQCPGKTQERQHQRYVSSKKLFDPL
jgi:hypothetical protein